jgi:hypothetical protein
MPKILSQALAHLQSITRTSPQMRCCVAYAHSLCPFRGFSPLQRISIAKSSTLSGTPGSSHTAELVAPPGFLTLSTPCSLGDLPGLFHPGSAHGVRPSRPFSFVSPLARKPKDRGAVRPLERRAPRGSPSSQMHRATPRGSLQGLTHHRKLGFRPPGLAENSGRLPPWD